MEATVFLPGILVCTGGGLPGSGLEVRLLGSPPPGADGACLRLCSDYQKEDERYWYHTTVFSYMQHQQLPLIMS